jgi:NAD-dependent deacetylase
LVWEWYNWRRELIADKKPNPAHLALVDIEGKMDSRRAQFHLLTQNVDGLHGLAGNRSLIELHGNIWKVRCTGCGAVKEDRRMPIPIPPYCLSCGKMLRPHIVWFGESLDPEDVDRSIIALENCEVMLVIGTSGVVQPAASFASTARAAGAFVVEINPDASSSVAHVALRGRAAEIVPQLV